MKKAMFIVLGVSLLASLLFLVNHGFAGGHGILDRILGILALPWVLVHWPESFYSHDFIWLVFLPFVLNSLCVLVLIGIPRYFRDKTK